MNLKEIHRQISRIPGIRRLGDWAASVYVRNNEYVEASNIVDEIIAGKGDESKCGDVLIICGGAVKTHDARKVAKYLRRESIFIEDINQIDLMNNGDDIVIIPPCLESVAIYSDLLDLGFMPEQIIRFSSPIGCLSMDLLDVSLGVSCTAPKSKLPGWEIYGEPEKALIKVCTLGGSTTAYQYDNIRCWSYFLYQNLNKMFDGRVVVYCGGIGGYTVSEECIKLVRDVLPLNPDIVISYSGVNNVNDNRFCEGSFFTQKKAEDYYNKVIKKNPYNYMTNTKIKAVTYGLKNDMSPGEQWLELEKTMYDICKGRGIQFLSFLQPCLYYQSRTEMVKEKEYNGKGMILCPRSMLGQYAYERPYSYYQNVYSFYEEVKGCLCSEEYSFIEDLSTIFDDYKKNEIFHDICHVYERGNRLIAKSIMRKVLPLIRKSIKQKVVISDE